MDQLTPEQQAEQEAAAAAAEAAGEKDAKIAELTSRIDEVNKTLLSPEYAEFLAQKAKPKPESKTPATEAEKAAFLTKLEGMSRAEYAAFMRDAIVAEVREQLFEPLVRVSISEKAQAQVAECAAKHQDFEEVRPKMIEVAREYPGINAEDAYQLAKARLGKPSGEPKAPAKPPAPSEVPGGRKAAPKVPSNVKFEDAFEQAAAKAGLTF